MHVSRFQGLVLWTSPQIDSGDDWAKSQYSAAWPLRTFGAIGFPPGAWNALRLAATAVPEESAIPLANGRCIADAWALGPGRPMDLEDLLPMLRARLIGGDTLDRDSALRLVEYWIDRFHKTAAGQDQGVLKTYDDLRAETETLYFDGPHAEDWLAFARRGDEYLPALDGRHILVPNQVAE